MAMTEQEPMSPISTRLGFINRYLTVWIFFAIAVGIAVGRVFPQVSQAIAGMQVGATSLPIAIGLMLMMYPPLTRVNYGGMRDIFRNRRLLIFSLLMNWVVGPILMTGLAVLFLRDYPEYMIGVILVGLARCIAMVIVWNELAEGDRELAVGMVAFNALFQVLFYALYIYLFITVLLNALGLTGGLTVHIGIWEAAKTVLVYLGIPFAAGIVTRFTVIKRRGRDWFERVFIKRLSPLTLVALLFTVVVMFSLKGEVIVATPGHVLLIALPLSIYFLVMWFAAFWGAKRFGAGYPQVTAVAFTAASNDFELAIAVAVALFGIGSPQAFATVVGPLLEVPILVLLVSVAIKLRGSFHDYIAGERGSAAQI